MKIFISHSLKDKYLIKSIKSILEPHGIILYIAEHYYSLRNDVTQKIKFMINDCDIALIILTQNGFNSNFVQQEIGYIHRANKPIINLVENGLENKITGFNYGRDFIQFDPQNPYPALNKVRNILLRHWIHLNQISLNKLRIEQQIQQQKDNAKAILGILAGIFIVGALSNN